MFGGIRSLGVIVAKFWWYCAFEDKSPDPIVLLTVYRFENEILVLR